jgi:hypothetical protein
MERIRSACAVHACWSSEARAGRTVSPLLDARTCSFGAVGTVVLGDGAPAGNVAIATFDVPSEPEYSRGLRSAATQDYRKVLTCAIRRQGDATPFTASPRLPGQTSGILVQTVAHQR